jgi:acyl-CoA dehydrogenase
VIARRDVFTPDHEAFREVVRAFLAKEVVPHFADWEKTGQLPREVFQKLGDLGLIGTAIPEEHGGGGQDDYRYNVVLQEEAAWWAPTGCTGPRRRRTGARSA